MVEEDEGLILLENILVLKESFQYNDLVRYFNT